MGHLIALKILARDDRSRPQDWDDLRALVEEATPPELDLALQSVKLVESRGFNRGRDLVASVKKLMEGSNLSSTLPVRKR